MTRVTLIRGDGIGPEIMDAAAMLVEATGAPIEWEEHPAGASAIAEHSTPLPAETLASIRKNKVAFKAPLMTPVGGGYRSVNVLARQELDLYANISVANTRRIVRFAFEYARANGRKKVTLVHKANILKLTTGLFLRVGQEIAEEYPDIIFEDRIVDATAMQLVMFPERFDVIVTTNLFGDILSDLTAGLVGGLGLAPSGNYGEDCAIFEAIHGTAPDIAGRNISNPTALTLSGAMMLHHLGYHEHGQRLDDAVRGVIAEGKHLTPDLKGTATTDEFAQAVRARL